MGEFLTPTCWGAPAPTALAGRPSKCVKTSAPPRASAGAPGAHRTHLPGPLRGCGSGAGAPARPRCRAPASGPTISFANRLWTEGGLGSRAASPALGARGAARAAAERGPGLGGRHRGRRPRAIWTPSAGAFEVVRGGSLFARPFWLGAWRWFTAWMPLNLFPGDPGSIRPGPEGGCQASRVIKGGLGPFTAVELGAGVAGPRLLRGAGPRPPR